MNRSQWRLTASAAMASRQAMVISPDQRAGTAATAGHDPGPPRAGEHGEDTGRKTAGRERGDGVRSHR